MGVVFTENLRNYGKVFFAVRNLIKNEKKYYEEVLHSSRNNLMVI